MESMQLTVKMDLYCFHWGYGVPWRLKVEFSGFLKVQLASMEDRKEGSAAGWDSNGNEVHPVNRK